MNRFRGLIHELHRRSIWQVLGVYVVGAYLVVEVIGNLDDVFGLPDWVASAALVLFLVGLPIVLATAFVQEGAPEPADLIGHSERPELPGFQSTSDAALDTPPPPGLDRDYDGVADAPPQAAAPANNFLERHLTWRRAILVGIAAFLLLAISTASYMGLRQSGVGPWGTLLARGVMSESDRVLLADFSAAGEDSLMAQAVTEALRVDLERSDVVRLVDPAAVQRVLTLMEREPGAQLDERLAREVALRDGIEGILLGSVNRLGDARVLTARLVSTSDGAVLASFRQTADDAGEVVEAVDRLSEDLRERVGESLGSIRRSPPLERVTTGSLDALERYSQAVRMMAVEPESRRATRLLEEAVAIDSSFAMAHLQLARSYGMYGTQERVEAALQAAYRLRDRLSERERYLAEGDYLAYMRGDSRGAAEVLRQAAEAYPDDPWIVREYANALSEIGRFAEAERQTRRSIALDSLDALAHDGLIFVLARQGRYDESAEALAQARRLFPADSLWHMLNLGAHAFLAGDLDATEEAFERLARGGAASDNWRGSGQAALADLAQLRGRLALARERFDEAAQLMPATSDHAALWSAAYHATLLQERGLDASEPSARLLEEARTADLENSSVPYAFMRVADLLARLGHPDEARRVVARWRSSADPDDLVRERGRLLAAEAQIEFAEGRPERAIELTRRRRAADPGCPECGLDELAEVFAALGQADSAAAYWQRYLDEPYLDRLENDAYDLPDAHLFLAAYHDDRGTDSVAARHYAALVELWQDADPVLQPVVRQAQARLVALTREPR